MLAVALAALPGCGSCVGDRQEEPPAVQNTGRARSLGDRTVQLDPTNSPIQMLREASTHDQ